MEFKPRPYQAECLDVIAGLPPGAYLVKMATGLGKTATFCHVPRQGRMLILSHREELVHQPLQWFDCPAGVEQGPEHAPPGCEVVSASVQTMQRRMEQYRPDAFDVIIVDEAHHAAARSYRRILSYFTPRLLLGFTATPNRSDRVRLNDVFSRIVFDRDLRWAIRNGYLCDILCLRAEIGYDLSGVHTRNGDYAPGELDEAMDGTADAIAQVYRDRAQGATLIFAVSIHQCEEIAARIPGAVVVTGETKDRAVIIRRFTAGEIPCIVNCMVFTEGTDIPRVETVIIARPTKSDSLYTQMVGRGLRLYPGKEKLTLIDCVGVTGCCDLCTAPSLLGIDLADVPPKKQAALEGMLFDLPQLAEAAADTPQSWIKNIQTVDLWAKSMQYDTHGVNYFKMPDGSLRLDAGGGNRITIPPADELGNVPTRYGTTIPMQEALDRVYDVLTQKLPMQEYLWNANKVKHWGDRPATDKQRRYVSVLLRRAGYDVPANLSKLDATQIINRLGGKCAKESHS